MTCRVTRDEAVEWEEHREQNLVHRRAILKQLEDSGIDVQVGVRQSTSAVFEHRHCRSRQMLAIKQCSYVFDSSANDPACFMSKHLPLV